MLETIFKTSCQDNKVENLDIISLLFCLYIPDEQYRNKLSFEIHKKTSFIVLNRVMLNQNIHMFYCKKL